MATKHNADELTANLFNCISTPSRHSPYKMLLALRRNTRCNKDGPLILGRSRRATTYRT
jgi:hypothetical protein